MSAPFTEWTRQEKDEFASRRMSEMKLLNEKYKKRHQEVERDRMRAEAKNSSVTSLIGMTKEKSALDDDIEETVFSFKPKAKERAWDKGKHSMDLEKILSCANVLDDAFELETIFSFKPKRRKRDKGKHSMDLDNWNRRKFEQPHYGNWRDPDRRTDQRYNRNEENWRSREALNAYKDHQRFREFGRLWGKKNFFETKKSSSGYRNYSNFSRQRDRRYNRERNYNAPYASFRDSNVRDSRKKTYMVASTKASRSSGDSEIEPIKQPFKIESDLMWRDNDMNEVRNRQIRVEKWVKSVNATSPLKVEDGFTATELIKRSAFNSSVGTDIELSSPEVIILDDSDTEQNKSPEVEILDYIENKTDIATSINPIKVSGNFQREYIQISTWSDSEYDDEEHPVDVQQLSLPPLSNVHSEIVDVDCESYREADDSDYDYVKEIESENEDFDEEPGKQDNLNSEHLEEIKSVENGNVVNDSNLKFNDDSIVNTESSSIQDNAIVSGDVEAIEAVKMAGSTETVNILDPKVMNDKEIECLLNVNAPYHEDPSLYAKNCTADEMHANVAYDVSEKMETSMEEASEDAGSEISYNLDELSDSNLSITHSEKKIDYRKTSKEQGLETINQEKSENVSVLTTP